MKPQFHSFALIGCLLASSILIAQQRGPAPDPLVKENATVKLGPHTYVIPDNNVGLGTERRHRGRIEGNARDRSRARAAQW
jgi:hypothetical protein